LRRSDYVGDYVVPPIIVVKEGFEYAGGKGFLKEESVLISLPGNMSPQRVVLCFCFCFTCLALTACGQSIYSDLGSTSSREHIL